MIENVLGQEALTQHARSPLFEDILALSKPMFSHLEDQQVDKSILLRYFKQSDFKRKLQQIIEKHMGIYLTNVATIDNQFPILMIVFHPADISKQGKLRPIRNITTTMAKIRDFYDDKTGLLSKDSGLTHTKIFITLGIYTGWFIKNKDGKSVFTPEEFTAGIIHELGHCDDWIKRVFRTHAVLSDGAEIVDYVSVNKDPKNIEKLIAILEERKDTLPREWRKTFQVVSRYFKDNPNSDDNLFTEALTVLTVMIEASVSKKLESTFIPIGASQSIRRTSVLDTASERDADEFSTRHGAGQYLIAYLTKLEVLQYDPRELVDKSYYNQVYVFLAKTFGAFLGLYGTHLEDFNKTYDPILVRLEAVLETQKHAFSKSDIPPEVLSILKQDIEEGLKCIADEKSKDAIAFRRRVETWRQTLENTGRIVTSPFTDRLNKDYDRLQRASIGLSRNPLYYLAKR